MRYKGFTKLIVQIGLLSVSMMALSFITETDYWIYYFNNEKTMCYGDFCRIKTTHFHWNYRGWVYFTTELIYFGISIVKIALSHKEEDFK